MSQHKHGIGGVRRSQLHVVRDGPFKVGVNFAVRRA